MKLIFTITRPLTGPEFIAINRWLSRARAMGLKVYQEYVMDSLVVTVDSARRPEPEMSAAEFEQRIRDGQAIARRQRELGITGERLHGEAIGPLVAELALRFGLAQPTTRKAPRSPEAGPEAAGGFAEMKINLGSDVLAAWARLGDTLAKMGESIRKGY